MDFYKHERSEDIQCFRFETEGEFELINGLSETSEIMHEISANIRNKRLIPGLTNFCVTNSKSFKQEFIRFRNNMVREYSKYKDNDTVARDTAKELMLRRMTEIDLEMDYSSAGMEGITQTLIPIEEMDDVVRYDQPIEEASLKYEPQILKELNQSLLNMNPAMEDYSQTQVYEPVPTSYQPNFDDYGGVDIEFQRDPLNYMTPTNILTRAQQRLDTIENSYKQYNLKTDIKLSSFKAHSEVYGPDSIVSGKIKSIRARKIIRSEGNNPQQQRNKSQNKNIEKERIDFDIPIEETFKESFMKEVWTPPLKMKSSKSSKIFTKEDFDKMEFKFLKPYECLVSPEEFQSLFTRNVKDYNLKEELQRDAIKKEAIPSHFNPELATDTMMEGREDYQNQFGGFGMDDDNYGGGMDMELYNGSLMRGSAGDSTYLKTEMFGENGEINIVANYLDYNATDDNIGLLEKKLRQQHNFKITEFKKYMMNKYISKIGSLNDSSISSSSNKIRPQISDAFIRTQKIESRDVKGLSFKEITRDIISYWHENHDVRITVQTCFLTILHLSIENNLLLKSLSEDGDDFIITVYS